MSAKPDWLTLSATAMTAKSHTGILLVLIVRAHSTNAAGFYVKWLIWLKLGWHKA